MDKSYVIPAASEKKQPPAFISISRYSSLILWYIILRETSWEMYRALTNFKIIANFAKWYADIT